MTEGLTRGLISISERINGNLNTSSYPWEEDLLAEIEKVGELDFKPFYEAYFEEPDLGSQPGDRMPKWHALQQMLGNKFGPRFLHRLDDYIGEYKAGSPETIARLEALIDEDAEGKSKIQRMRDDWERQVNLHGLIEAKRLALDGMAGASRAKKVETQPLFV